jgi:dephospho-CoA kinase
LENISKNKNIKIHYINLDEITKEIHIRQDLPIFQNIRNEIKTKFGDEVLNKDGTTNKKLL